MAPSQKVIVITGAFTWPLGDSFIAAVTTGQRNTLGIIFQVAS